MAEEVSKNGVWVDTKTGKVVESQPEEGIQLVAPGATVTPDVAAQIAAARRPASKSSEPVDLSVVDKSTKK